MENTSEQKLREQLAELSPEQKQEIKAELENKPPKRSTYKDSGILRRKKILKGKIAPLGYVYLVLTVHTKRLDDHGIERRSKEIYAYQLLPGGLGNDAEEEVADGLRKLIKDKYHI